MIPAKFSGHVHSLFRFIAGFLFFWHGTQKLFGWPPSSHGEAPAFVKYVGGGLELVGGVLLMIGFMTRSTAFVCSGLMAAAYWMAHGTKSFLPIMNGGELAVLYCFAFLWLAAVGGGPFSVDAMKGKKG
ncbi:MAG: DoxX family protein [Acidobacteriota bacterium]